MKKDKKKYTTQRVVVATNEDTTLTIYVEKDEDF